MSLQAIFGSGDSDGSLNQEAFVVIIFAIIIGWILVSLFQRVLEDFTFSTLGMNSRSTVHALIIALSVSMIFIVFIWMIDEYQIIPASAAAQSLEEATGGLVAKGGDDSASNTLTEQIGNSKHGHPIVITKLNYYGG